MREDGRTSHRYKKKSHNTDTWSMVLVLFIDHSLPLQRLCNQEIFYWNEESEYITSTIESIGLSASTLLLSQGHNYDITKQLDCLKETRHNFNY